MSKFMKRLLIGGAVAAGAGLWATAPRSFGNRRANYVPTLPNVMYAHRGLHDAGSGYAEQYAEGNEGYCELARSMAIKAGFGSPDDTHAIAPENSLAAFAAAAEAGFGIELDLQLTSDGQVVVLHDPDLKRVAGDPRLVKDLTYDELVRLPLFPNCEPGTATAPLRSGAEENPPLVVTPDEAPSGYYQHVPLLEDVLKVVDGRAPIIVEFKFANLRQWDDRDDELMQKASDLLLAYEGPYVVESFSPIAMNWYKNHYPSVCRGQLAVDPAQLTSFNPVETIAGVLGLNWLSRPDFVAYDWKNGDRSILKFERKMGAMSVAWTVRSDEELSESLPYFDRYIFEGFIPPVKPSEIVSE